MNNKKNRKCKLPSAKLDRVPSISRIQSPKRINKQRNAQGSTKFLKRSNSIKNMDFETDHIIANLNQEDA